MREMWVQACVPGHHFSSLPFEGFSGDMSPFFFFRKCMGEVCSYAYSDGSKTKGGQSPQAFSMGKSFEIGLSGYAYAVKFIVQCVTVVIVTIIAKSVILLFHIFPQSRQSLKPCQFITFKKEMANAPNMKPRVKYRTDIRG